MAWVSAQSLIAGWVERNVGEIDHSDWQTAIAAYLRAHYSDVWAGVEVRVQVRPTRFPVPDVTVV